MDIPRPKISFFTPGRRLDHKDSYIIIDQSYVQYKPASSRAPSKPLPILFIHGGGLTGAQWESTPDLRPGWACLANGRGYDAYLLDTVDNGRSARAPDHARPDTDVEHRTAKEVWTNFRFGPDEAFDERGGYEGGQFPMEYFDALLASQVSRRRTNDAAEAKAIVDALKMIGDCHIVAHSHGAALVMDALGDKNLISVVLQHVKSMVFIEPGPTSSAEHLQDSLPTLIVWGDYLRESKIWLMIIALFEKSSAEVLNLPVFGIKGNSHFPMCERNSDAVFEIILKWLEG